MHQLQARFWCHATGLRKFYGFFHQAHSSISWVLCLDITKVQLHPCSNCGLGRAEFSINSQLHQLGYGFLQILGAFHLRVNRPRACPGFRHNIIH